MKRFWLAGALAFLGPGAQAETLTDQQIAGRTLVFQSCGVCHAKPTLTSPVFGPTLSKATFAMGDDQPKKQIAEGSPNMPGFKYQFSAAQIDAIVAYLKTREPEAAAPAPAAKPAN